ncbi:unnamed protein product [Blepharisma stoltei]|uniref:EF-hand domain-containing protein n=1 Tax=Blepharisma stoltei TaxID=1481888 RepID=A0AAU9JQ65_9CILI|nr:unnamed protein product [Blepharisma stoltei]
MFIASFGYMFAFGYEEYTKELNPVIFQIQSSVVSGIKSGFLPEDIRKDSINPTQYDFKLHNWLGSYIIKRSFIIMDADGDKHARIQEMFKKFDKDGDQTINAKELEEYLLNEGINIEQEELQELIEKIDANGDGNIQYSEFERVMDDIFDGEAEENILKQIFDALDRDHDGQLGPDELKYALYCLGEEVSDPDVENMIHFVTNGNNYVDFDVFKKISK